MAVIQLSPNTKSNKFIRAALKPSVAIGNVITSGLEKITGKKYGRATTEDLAKTTAGKMLGGSIIAGTAALAAAASPAIVASAGVRSIAGTVAKKAAVTAITKPVQTLVVAGVVASGAAPLIGKTLFTAGKTTGEVITGEKTLSAETVMDVAKGAGVILGIGAVGTAAGYVGKKILEKDEAVGGTPIEAQAVPASATSPITPVTEEIDLEPSVKRKRKRSQPRSQKISQSVRVTVLNNNSAHRTNKFIKNMLYATT